MDKQEELLNEYAEALLLERGVSDDLPDEVLGQMRKDILERLNNFFIARVLETLPADKIDELDKMIQEKESDEVWKYIHSNLEDFDKFSMEVLADFRNKYLGL